MGFFSCTELLAVYAWNAALRVILSSVKKHVMDIQSEIGSGMWSNSLDASSLFLIWLCFL